MTTEETDNIVSRVLAGEVDAYEAVVCSYQQEVWKVVAAMLYNTLKTEDLVEQTFINAFQHLHKYQQGRDFGAWIKEIARNQVRQEIRRSSSEARRMEIYRAHLEQSYAEASSTQRETLLEEALAECTANLPSSSSQLLDLRYHSVLDFGEIASRIGRSVEATRQQLARIRLALRECIEKRIAQP
jgi:RNA polymerase sigma-70 factor (ECF subfamily)